MPTDYAGKPAQIVQSTSKSISSSTNTTPIVMVTSVPHGLQDGGIVRVINHATNTAANGFWQVVVTSNVAFELHNPVTGANSVGNGVGGATGTVQIIGSGTYQIPSDGDDIDAASVNVALETLGDRTALSYWKTPQGAVLVDSKYAATSDPTMASWNTGAGGNAAWAEDGGVSTFIGGHDLDVVNGDIVEVSISTTLDNTVIGHGVATFGWFVHLYDYGTSPAFGSATVMAGYEQRYEDNIKAPLTVHGKQKLSLTRGKKARFYLAAYQYAAARSYDFLGGRAFDLLLYR